MIYLQPVPVLIHCIYVPMSLNIDLHLLSPVLWDLGKSKLKVAGFHEIVICNLFLVCLRCCITSLLGRIQFMY